MGRLPFAELVESLYRDIERQGLKDVLGSGWTSRQSGTSAKRGTLRMSEPLPGASVMMTEKSIRPIAYIEGDFPEKFGIPRQSGLVNTQAEIAFPARIPPTRKRSVDWKEYSHLWLIWDFSEAEGTNWRPTVRPPRLGGNQRVGVFATRSPFRPNGMGLSCVKLTTIDWEHGVVTGANRKRSRSDERDTNL